MYIGDICEEFDHGLIDAMRRGDDTRIRVLIFQDLLENGDVEFRQWIVLLGALSGRMPAWTKYPSFYRAITGMAAGYLADLTRPWALAGVSIVVRDRRACLPGQEPHNVSAAARSVIHTPRGKKNGDLMSLDPRQLRTIPVGYNDGKFGEPEYTDWLDESMSWKKTCYIGDWTFLNKRRFTGPEALRLFSDISVNGFTRYDIGQAKHVVHCHSSGNVIHEGILSRLGEQEFMLFGRGTYWADYKLRTGGYDATSVQEDMYTFQVSGPNALAVVEAAAGCSMRDVGFMRFKTIEIAGHSLWALRQGMAGEIGFELQGRIEHRQTVYDTIYAAGEDYGIRRLGGRANRVNHLEACFPTVLSDYLPAIFEADMEEYRTEYDAQIPAYARTYSLSGSFNADHISAWYRNPVELGWGKSIRFDHDFIGREALEREMASPRRAIRTLVWNPEDVIDVYASLFRKDPNFRYMEMPRDRRGFIWQDAVLRGGEPVGVSTSRGYSYYFREMISLATIDVAHSEIGTGLTVVWGEPGGPQKHIRATVAPAPYKTDNRKLDLSTVRPNVVNADRPAV